MNRLLIRATALLSLCCRGPDGVPSHLGYTVVAEYPHDTTAYTQGLLFRSRTELLESTGLHGRSSLRTVPVRTGIPTQVIRLPADRFGEGIAILANQVYQLTWQSEVAYVYALNRLHLLDSVRYHGEGWGLTTVTDALIMSNGSDTLTRRDPTTFAVLEAVPVRYPSGLPAPRLNELEYYDGQIFANVYQSDWILRIDWPSGIVRDVIDLNGLLPSFGADKTQENVLNGIAIDTTSGHLFVTGKRWPKLFELKLPTARSAPPS